MNRRFLFILMIATLIFLVSGCSSHTIDFNQNNISEQEISDENLGAESEMNNNDFDNKIHVTINDKKYNLFLEDNDTARELLNNLPLEYNMEELNGNEKYIYMTKKYPTNSLKFEYINQGDVMLYEDDCLVIFYKSFATSYSYTKIGHIENLEDLGSGDITAKYTK